MPLNVFRWLCNRGLQPYSMLCTLMLHSVMAKHKGNISLGSM
jgi:hypothetical protein